MGRLAMTPSIVTGLVRGDRAERAKTAWRPMDPGPKSAPPGIEETKRPGHGGRKTKDAPVAVAIE